MSDELQYNKLFKNFAGRDEDLRKIKRYSYYKMLYRSNVLSHSHRVAAIVRALNGEATKVFAAHSYDPNKAIIMGYVHDDAEIITGDVLAGDKSKMTPEQLKKLKQAEEQAINKIGDRFPKYIAGYSYQDLIEEAETHKTLESQVVQYADKYDALGEALHEMHAGNWHFTTNVTNQYGLIPTPIEYYYDYFKNYSIKYPKMQPLLECGLALFKPINRPSKYKNIVKKSKLHNSLSITQPTGDNHYDQWLKITRNCGNEETVKALYAQKEYL